VDPVFFDGTYYLSADKGGAKPYGLLSAALRKTDQCAVGRWITRGKEHIVIIRPMDTGLAMHQLHFEAEVRSMKELGVEETPVSDAELKLAEQLIDHLSAKQFDPHEYHDEFKGRIEAAIQKKVKGKEISLSEAPVAAAGNVIDLMDALRLSLGAKAVKAAAAPARKDAKRARDAGARKSARR
jgi:DNA end-binding protein Ku